MGKINELYLQAMAQTDWNVHVDETGKCLCALCTMVMKYLCFVSIELNWEDLPRITTPIQKCNESNEQATSFQWIKYYSHLIYKQKNTHTHSHTVLLLLFIVFGSLDICMDAIAQ